MRSRTSVLAMCLVLAWVGVQSVEGRMVFSPTLDPLLVEGRKLLPSVPAAGDGFGVAVAVFGDTMLVGAPDDDDGGDNSGSAYVFERNLGGVGRWGKVRKLTASDGAANDRFGLRVAISGDVVVVGAHRDDDAGTDSGSAYVFERNHGGANSWGEVKKLTASDAGAYDKFGHAVGISGDTLLVGTTLDDDGGINSGSAYVFERNFGSPGNWGEVRKLMAGDAAPYDQFGQSVAIDGDIAVVGAYYNDDAGSESGSAYVFERNFGSPGNWGQIQKLTASDAAAGDRFGRWVGVSGDVTVVGAYRDDDSGTSSGSAYVFGRNRGGKGTWGEAKKLTASLAAADEYFGISVAICGDVLVVGANRDDHAGINSGSAYLFKRDFGGPDNWGAVQKLVASDAAASDYFGYPVAIYGDTVVLGADHDDDAGADSGSAYVFTPPYLRHFISDAAPSADLLFGPGTIPELLEPVQYHP